MLSRLVDGFLPAAELMCEADYQLTPLQQASSWLQRKGSERAGERKHDAHIQSLSKEVVQRLVGTGLRLHVR